MENKLKRETRILHHRITYQFKDYPDLLMDDCNLEHVEYMIGQGYSEGELNQHYEQDLDEKLIRGYWKIDNSDGIHVFTAEDIRAAMRHCIDELVPDSHNVMDRNKFIEDYLNQLEGT